MLAIGLASPLVNLVGKQIFGRNRPSPVNLPLARLLAMPTSASFPSGHSASAAAFATAVAMEAPGLVAAPVAVVAAAVCFSRVYTGVHYPGDVLAGAGVGVATGLLTWRLWPRPRPAAGEGRVRGRVRRSRSSRRRRSPGTSRLRASTSLRRIFRLAVSSPVSTEKSAGRMAKSLTVSYEASVALTASTASRTTWRRRGCRASSGRSDGSAGRPSARAQGSTTSGSSVTSAVQKLRRSPCTTTCDRYGQAALILPSMCCGATYLPPEVLISSFFRSVMRSRPASSSSPMSPVRSQPSCRAAAVSSGSPW
ncbi:phosphatase PAP2 family protein [Thermocatellispora tengchongensis]|uniref:phosphatase PAP2 family protein n=1 Tax=Thermocatellispora tengchongensis TaxID=1073253 RepID=UPI003624FAE0